MTMRFRMLGSSSSGNAALLKTEHARVLIDAGFSARQLERRLASVGESLEAIDAIFLTHEHFDHSAGLRGLAKYPHIRVYANAETSRAIQRELKFRPAWQLFETGNTFQFKDLEVSTFSIPHDAADPVGYRFSAGADDLLSPRRTLVWCTDLGHAPALVREKICGADVLILESNYDPAMLDASERSFALKQRIRGRHGHLANADALALVDQADKSRLQHLYLAHLSNECNNPELVSRSFSPLAQAHKLTLSVVPPKGEPLPEYEF